MRTDETDGMQNARSDEEALKALDAELTAAFRRHHVELDDLVAAMNEPEGEIPPADLDSLFVDDGEAPPNPPPPRRLDRPVAPAIMPRRRGFLLRHRTVLAGAAIVLLSAGGVVLKVGVDPIVAAGQGLVRLVMEGPAARQKVVIEEIGPERLPDPLAILAEDAREALTDKFAMPIAQPFKAALITTPDRLCEVLLEEGLPNYGWLPVAEGSPVYECVSDLVPIPNPSITAEAKPERTAPFDLRPEEDGDGTTAAVPPAAAPGADEADAESAPKPQLSSFFFSARGRKDRIDSIRFKLNLNDPTVRTDAINRLVGYLDRVSPMISWSRPEDLKPAILKRKRVSNRSRGVLYQVLPETGGVERINVVVILTEPALLPKPGLVMAAPQSLEMPVPVDPAASLPLPQGVTPAFALAPVPGQDLKSEPAEPAEPLPDGAIGPVTPVAALPLSVLGGGGAEAAGSSPDAEAPSAVRPEDAGPGEAPPLPDAASDGPAVSISAEDPPSAASDAVAARLPDAAPVGAPETTSGTTAAAAPSADLGALIDSVDPVEPASPPVLPRPRPVVPATVVEPVPAPDVATAPSPAPVAEAAAAPAEEAAPVASSAAEAPQVVPPPRVLPSPITAPLTSQRTLPAPVTSYSIPILEGIGEAPGLPGVKY